MVCSLTVDVGTGIVQLDCGIALGFLSLTSKIDWYLSWCIGALSDRPQCSVAAADALAPRLAIGASVNSGSRK